MKEKKRETRAQENDPLFLTQLQKKNIPETTRLTNKQTKVQKQE